MSRPERVSNRDHYTYLLSLWQEGRAWRAALRPADGGPRLGFGDLDQLMAYFLRLQDEPGPAHPVRRPDGGTDEHEDA